MSIFETLGSLAVEPKKYKNSKERDSAIEEIKQNSIIKKRIKKYPINRRDTINDFIFNELKGLVKGRTKEVSIGRKQLQKDIANFVTNGGTFALTGYRGLGKSGSGYIVASQLTFMQKLQNIIIVSANDKSASKLLNNLRSLWVSDEGAEPTMLELKYQLKVIVDNARTLIIQTGYKDKFVPQNQYEKEIYQLIIERQNISEREVTTKKQKVRRFFVKFKKTAKQFHNDYFRIYRHWFYEKRQHKIHSYGIYSEMRGDAFKTIRTQALILDDVEKTVFVNTAEQRDKLYNTYTSAVEKLFDTEDKKRWIFAVGSKLHQNGLMNRIEKKSRIVRSVKLVRKFPKTFTYWEQIARSDNPEKEYRKLLSSAYSSNIKNSIKKQILKELVTDFKIDNPYIPKWLIIQNYILDPIAFLVEMQNQPPEQDTLLNKFKFTEEKDLPNDLLYFGALDPSLGLEKGDYQGFSIVGISRKTRKQYAVLATRFKKDPLEFKEIIETAYNRYRFTQFAIESNQFQSFYSRILKEMIPNKISNKITPINSTENKRNKLIKLGVKFKLEVMTIVKNDINQGIERDSNNNPIELKDGGGIIKELKNYPETKHDDAIDSLAIASNIAEKYLDGNNSDTLEKNRKKLNSILRDSKRKHSNTRRF